MRVPLHYVLTGSASCCPPVCLEAQGREGVPVMRNLLTYGQAILHRERESILNRPGIQGSNDLPTFGAHKSPAIIEAALYPNTHHNDRAATVAKSPLMIVRTSRIVPS